MHNIYILEDMRNGSRSEPRESRSHRALMEELEYLRRREVERHRYGRMYEADRYYDSRPEYDRMPHYDLERDRDRYGSQTRSRLRDEQYPDDRYADDRYRDDAYDTLDRRGGKGGGYYMGHGDPYYGGRRM